MSIKSVRYTGPIFDHSGYAKANRENILALYEAGVNLTLNPISFEDANPELIKEEKEILESLVNRQIDYDVNIIHTTPEFWEKYKEPEKINLGYTIWETDKLHPKWPEYINNNVDGVMVGCEWNVDVFKNSGVTIPIFNVPHCYSFKNINSIDNYNIKNLNNDTFVFYFIGQFTERKHPTALLKAYWSAFNHNEDVALVVKTYRSDYSEREKEAVRNTIITLKKVCPAEVYPPIYLIPDMLSEDEILNLHKRGDCYISLDRGEGFGLSTFHAGIFGNPVIATGFGGVTEYLKEDNSYLVDYNLTPVFGMPYSPWYRLDQKWAEPNINHAVELMKYVYNNRKEANDKGLKLQESIKNNFSRKVIAQKIINAIENL